MTERKPVLVRIEVPFCVKPCGWKPDCKVIPGWNLPRQKEYVQAVCTEIRANAEQFVDVEVKAVRFGGGIASIAGEETATVMRCIRESFTLASDAPVTMRSSISNISGANMTWFKRAGICRFDFEMMSLCQNDFYLLNRQDSFQDYQTVCDYILRTYATDLLGLYLAYGKRAELPTQTIQNFRDSLLQVTRSHVAHLILIQYEGESPASAEEQAEQLAQAHGLLEEEGFVEYIPFHFARPGLEDLYFKARFEGASELAFGLGAQTRFDGVLSTNTSDYATYVTDSADFSCITASVVPL